MIAPCTDVVALSKKLCQAPILGDLKYSKNDNFLGRPVLGYHPAATDVCLMTPEAAKALCHAQNYLQSKFNCGLIIYDAFRPLRAVRDFANWVESEPTEEYELKRKFIHYPTLTRREIGSRGYLALDVSRHCFGGSVDVFLVSLETKAELEMGAVFDFFGKKSHISAPESEIGKEAFKNRQVLLETMNLHGFAVYEEEFWHFDYKEREITEPMDFEITPEWRGALSGLNKLRQE